MDEVKPIYGRDYFEPEREFATASFQYIHRDIEDIKHQFIRLGFHLYECQRMEYYKDFGYSSFDEFVAVNFHMEKSAVSRHISLFWRFSEKNGSVRTMFLGKDYEKYSYSQLCEMVTLPDNKMRKIRPDMTVAQIRDMKRSWKNKSAVTAVATSQQELEQKNESCPCDGTEISALGAPLTVRKEDDLIQTKGCKGHDCFSCAADCRVRQENRYCVEAPFGEPFGCTTMHVIDNLRSEIGERCQFVNQELAFHNAAREAEPCCKECSVKECGYRCRRAVKVLDDIVQTIEYQEVTQPELPALKNNEQRKEFIDQYQSWPVWVDIPQTGERYYKYELEGNVKLAVKATLCRKYLGYDSKTGKNKYEQDKTFGAEEYYLFQGDMSAYEAKASKSVLVDYLKECQKKK